MTDQSAYIKEIMIGGIPLFYHDSKKAQWMINILAYTKEKHFLLNIPYTYIKNLEHDTLTEYNVFILNKRSTAVYTRLKTLINKITFIKDPNLVHMKHIYQNIDANENLFQQYLNKHFTFANDNKYYWDYIKQIKYAKNFHCKARILSIQLHKHYILFKMLIPFKTTQNFTEAYGRIYIYNAPEYIKSYYIGLKKYINYKTFVLLDASIKYVNNQFIIES